MRLKTLIIVGAGISLLITALLAAGLVWFTQNQSRLLREHYAADEFINGVYQLELLTSDYLLNHRQRAAEQWRLHFQSLQDASKRLSSVFPPRERDLINGNLDKLQQLFALTVESFGGGGVSGAVSSRQRILAGQLKTSIERVVSDVRHLSSDYATQFITFDAELRRFVWISFIVAAVLLGGLWLLVALRVIQPIHRLGMQIQHFAQDPDFRLENSRPDEVGDLSRSFDRLADRLQATTVSVESLQAEVEERRQIASVLRRSEHRLALLLDTLPYGVQENDIHGVITFSNAAHHRMLGRKQGADRAVDLGLHGHAGRERATQEIPALPGRGAAATRPLPRALCPPGWAGGGPGGHLGLPARSAWPADWIYLGHLRCYRASCHRGVPASACRRIREGSSPNQVGNIHRQIPSGYRSSPPRWK